MLAIAKVITQRKVEIVNAADKGFINGFWLINENANVQKGNYRETLGPGNGV